MAKPKRDINDALASAKKLRQDIEDENEKVDEIKAPPLDTPKVQAKKKSVSTEILEDEGMPLNVLSHWVRHTTGLRHRTRLRLQDAVDGQKKKARYGRLLSDEPRNEQEIVERGINLVLVELGYLKAVEEGIETLQENAA